MDTHTEWKIITEDGQIFCLGLKTEEQAKEELEEFAGCYVVQTEYGYLGWKDNLPLHECDTYDTRKEASKAIHEYYNDSDIEDECEIIQFNLHISQCYGTV